MYRKRWTVKILRMDLRYSVNGSGWCAPALAKMICIFFFSLLLHEEAVHSTRLIETDTFQEWLTQQDSNPYFDTSVPSNMTGLVGKTIQLVCRVKNLGNRTVSWVRHRDIHLLTIGRYTYTSDQRFEAMHTPHTEEWTLRIRYPQKKDSGIYECQISTTPPIGYSVHLNVVEPVTEIAGAPDLFINKYSTINLTCLVKYAPEPPSTIVWSHDHEAITFDTPRGGISLVTERGPVTSSRLLIQRAIEADAGLYTCSPSNTHSSSVHIHIVNEHPAAMHHGSGGGVAATLLTLVLLLFMII
ncbi:zwei Ig domain protein zig-8-like [Bombus vosnesenskii]|uniref:Zwei Ig domain protein zig-8-like n=4 Tax=Bombus TaxID=28641 RepID=A0A6J3K8D0_9HYME|nr:zwei Ig domain protein zig-8-like [Bombus impatiens]XP_024224761.1 zwei Ig domain protein zig-8-like [Bombus impatiens]XP_033196412.1 zwei Ig domain protein zig-8-like [Bombus vancouverensis nearcticus]XP_033196413.1 zwei Ig domain protein zig-8-like [Bombus vancouverensis nearcticus]XP_033312057.1 zwei Ig domain protein zig-8-like [Bombus bifarius]XP_033312058.1 zwei Ig domain protein zig-8-like [Bombus bifarius]XP_033349357.1 zwei Ig domain protein zig-8-like [Bombus vosnesenskii]XP_033